MAGQQQQQQQTTTQETEHDDRVQIAGSDVARVMTQHASRMDVITSIAAQLALTPAEIGLLRSGAPLSLTRAQYTGLMATMASAFAKAPSDGGEGDVAPEADACGCSGSPSSGSGSSGGSVAPVTTTANHVTEAAGTGTEVARGTVGSGASAGTVTLRRDVDTTNLPQYHNMFVISYRGADAQNAHWLQFIWREIIGIHADGSAHPLAGTMGTTAANTYELVTNGTATASGTPAANNYNTDSADSANPFYEAGGLNNRSADATTIYDQPSPQTVKVGEAFRAGAVRVISRAHFNTYLIQTNRVTQRVQTNVVWDVASGAAITPQTPGTVTGSTAAASSLDATIRTRFHAQYPAYSYIT